MTACVGLRREDKSEWERRVPLTPSDAEQLQKHYGLRIVAQSSPIRAFTDEEFARAGVAVEHDLTSCSIILGIKEMPLYFFEPGKTYIFFGHVIKGQPYNMPMLRRMLELGCTLIDYERVVDESNRRLIFFGWHAGVAGAINTLWALGQRLAWEGIPTPFADLRPTHTYHDLAEAKDALVRVRARIEREGLPKQITPLIIGVAGYGNVSRGVQEILKLLPVIEIEPEEVQAVAANPSGSRSDALYMAVFKEWHMVEPTTPQIEFQLKDYYDHPEKYRGVFERYLPSLSVLINAIYWTEAYPRLVTKAYLQELFGAQPGGKPRLRVIGDVSCDVEGAIECTIKSTEPGDPVFVYDPLTQQVVDGYEGPGLVVMAVEILPSELPREASVDFSRVLQPFMPAIAQCDFSVPFEECALPPEIKRAVIVHRGQLTPEYRYISKYLT